MINTDIDGDFNWDQDDFFYANVNTPNCHVMCQLLINGDIDGDANFDVTSLTTLPKRVPPVVCTCDADSIALKSVLYRVAFQPPLFILIRCKIRNLQLPQADGEATAEGFSFRMF